MLARSLFFAAILFLSFTSTAQNPPNWASNQLMEPSTLAQMLREENSLPLIFNVGLDPVIPHSVNIGTASKKENLDKFRKQLSTLPKDTKIVIYCGCCPFEHCPNVRPAIGVLKEMKFTNWQLLDLPNNIRADWINKGYPVVKL